MKSCGEDRTIYSFYDAAMSLTTVTTLTAKCGTCIGGKHSSWECLRKEGTYATGNGRSRIAWLKASLRLSYS